jgi:hypothetical protein
MAQRARIGAKDPVEIVVPDCSVIYAVCVEIADLK